MDKLKKRLEQISNEVSKEMESGKTVAEYGFKCANKAWQEGFYTCLDIVKNYLDDCNYLSIENWATVIDELNECVELHKNIVGD